MIVLGSEKHDGVENSTIEGVNFLKSYFLTRRFEDFLKMRILNPETKKTFSSFQKGNLKPATYKLH